MPSPKQNGIPAGKLWAVFLLFFLTNTFFMVFFYFTLSPRQPGEVSVQIPAGSTLKDISLILEQRGVIRSPLVFRLMAKLRKLDTELRAGEYVVPPGTDPWHMVGLLTTGRGEMTRFTIPEGLTDQQAVARIVQALPGLDPAKLMALARSDSTARALELGANRLIGYLFPDTYFVPPTIGEEAVLRLMVERFRQVYGELTDRRKSSNELDRNQSVILASIIEKEAMLDRERPIISSVFLNRITGGRPLESCATVLYVLGKHKSRLLYSDLEVDSPYNTYLHRGLPPGPICSPGRASLEAALFPAQTNFLYFVARGDGSHQFSRSLDEHVAAKRRYRSLGPSG
ncbi:MAG: endolytic transglycosylase MltG [Candidatus Glassbacteria bacterium]